ncbi:MAG: chromate transporter [Candidatus Omnitrophica bacterium]|nr:chromate transporter [Candidatus Omnitrophota bacterium]MBU4590392.1 chromate transporter [Candidatus Omnitrophota bacterium]
MILLNLFLSFLRIGLFAIGGAYSFLPLIEKEVVVKYEWLTKSEFLDVLGMVKILPGAISIKFATYTGFKIAGIPGAIIANLGNILGPASLIIIASSIYAKYKDVPSVQGAFNVIQLVIFAMILAVAFQLVSSSQLLSLRNILIIVVSFLLFSFTKIHPAIIIIAAALLGAFLK